MAINSTETAKEKIAFDIEAQSQGVAIKGYHTENGIFNASKLMEDLLKMYQNNMFSGYGASN